jgi:hypothetical protein
MAEHIHAKGATARAIRRAAGAATIFLPAIFLPLSIPRAAETDIALDNLAFAIGATNYRIPHLELKGAALSAAELAALFTGDEKALDARLERLTAKSLVMPLMTAETRTGDTVERAAYRDLKAEAIVAGRIGVARLSGVEQTVEKPGGESQSYVWGASTSKGVDLRQLAHIRLATRADPTEALKPVIEEERVESLILEDRARKMTVKTGVLAVTGVKGRALSAPPALLLEKLERRDSGAPPDDPAVLAYFIDALASLDVGSLEASGLAIAGKGEPAEKLYSVTIGRLAVNRIAGAVIGDLSLEDFALSSSDGGKLSLERFGLREARLASLVESAYPQLGHIEAKGLAADLPDIRTDDSSRMKFSLAGVEADFANFREIAPTKLSVRLDRFAIDLAARGEAPSTAQFLALGYRSLELSAAFAGEWNEKTQEAVFAPVRFEGKDIGTAELKVTLGNVSGAVFSSMAFVSKAAALSALAKSLELTLEGGGLIDRLLALEARERKTPAEKARAEYAQAVGILVTDLGGGGEKAKKIGEAASAFIIRPKRLRLKLASDKGINALDALAKKPGDILESLEVEATAER